MPDDARTDMSAPAPETPEALAEDNYQAYKASRVAPPTPAPEPVVVPETPTAPVAAPPQEPPADPEHEEPKEEPKPGTPDTRTPTEKRIAKAVRAQREAERREVAAREEAARLKGRLEALEATAPKLPPQIQAAGTVATAGAMPDNPADPKPKIEDFATYEEGVEATAAWVSRQTYKTLRDQERAETQRQVDERARQEAVKQQADLRTAYSQKVQTFREAHPDWDEVLNQDLPTSPDIDQFVIQSDSGPAIAYYLGQHPEECVALSKLQGPQVWKTLGKLEAKLEASPAPTAAPSVAVPATPAMPPAPPPVPVSHAPAPITPVRGAPMAAPASGESDYETYKRRRLAGKPV